MVDVVSPLLQRYVYPCVPPETLTLALPSLLPLQETGVEIRIALSKGGCPMENVDEDEQPVLSVTVAE